jgi:hypothetical protein
LTTGLDGYVATMTITHGARSAALLAAAAALATGALLAGCSNDDAVAPTDTKTLTTDINTEPATTPLSPSAPSTPPPVTGPETGTGGSPGGPSQTVSSAPSASPPVVERSPSAPTGDNLPGEDGGPNANPGTPGDDN